MPTQGTSCQAFPTQKVHPRRTPGRPGLGGPLPCTASLLRRARLRPSPVTPCGLVSIAVWGPMEPHFGFQGQCHVRDEAGLPPGGKTCSRWPAPYLDGVLELLVLPLQLLRLLQRAGRDEPGVQHRLAVADPAQHLKRSQVIQARPSRGSPWTSSDTIQAARWLSCSHQPQEAGFHMTLLPTA